jgi:hypothetical protein
MPFPLEWGILIVKIGAFLFARLYSQFDRGVRVAHRELLGYILAGYGADVNLLGGILGHNA